MDMVLILFVLLVVSYFVPSVWTPFGDAIAKMWQNVRSSKAFAIALAGVMFGTGAALFLFPNMPDAIAVPVVLGFAASIFLAMGYVIYLGLGPRFRDK